MSAAKPERAVLSVPEASARLGIGKTLGYELARTNRFPVRVLRLGRRLVVPTAALAEVLAGERGGRDGTGSSA